MDFPNHCVVCPRGNLVEVSLWRVVRVEPGANTAGLSWASVLLPPLHSDPEGGDGGAPNTLNCSFFKLYKGVTYTQQYIIEIQDTHTHSQTEMKILQSSASLTMCSELYSILLCCFILEYFT